MAPRAPSTGAWVELSPVPPKAEPDCRSAGRAVIRDRAHGVRRPPRSSERPATRVPPPSPAPPRRRAAREDGATIQRAVTTRDERRSEEHTSELQSLAYLVCRLLLEKKK